MTIATTVQPVADHGQRIAPPAGKVIGVIDGKTDRQAEQIASLAKPRGGHSFSYFGTWVTEQLSP